MRAIVLAALVLTAGVEAASAAPPVCKLERVASLDLLMGKETHAIFMPVTLNGTAKYLLIDTGGIYSTLSPEIAETLQLPTRHSRVQLQNLAGQVFDTLAVVDRFSFGEMRPTRVEFLLHPRRDRTIGLGGDFAGTIAPNILRNYDVEIDFASAKMNLFQPASCSNAAYWSDQNAAAIDMNVTESGHILFPMVLDGQRVTAGLDTGMSISALDLGIARRMFGVDTHAANVDNVGTLTGDARGAIYRVALHSLATQNGEISISNPRLHLLPDLTDGTAQRPELIVGLSTLKRLHVYIAYRHRMLYVTPASGPPAVTYHPPENATPNALGTPVAAPQSPPPSPGK